MCQHSLEKEIVFRVLYCCVFLVMIKISRVLYYIYWTRSIDLKIAYSLTIELLVDVKSIVFINFNLFFYFILYICGACLIVLILYQVYNCASLS